MVRTSRAVRLLTVLLTLGCNHEPTAATYRAVLRTDQSSYSAIRASLSDSLRRSITVVLQYSNESDAPIFLAACEGNPQPLFGMQLIGQDSVPIGTSTQAVFACSGGTPLRVESHSSRTDTITVDAPPALPANIRFFYIATGCATDLGACSPLLPESDRVSDVVRVSAAP